MSAINNFNANYSIYETNKELDEIIMEWGKNLTRFKYKNFLDKINEFLKDESQVSLRLESFDLKTLPDIFHDSRFSRLNSLRLENNQLKCLPESLSSLTNLNALFLQNNKLNTLPENFRSLTNLRVLNLENNRLTSLPDNFGSLTNLMLLDLKKNHLHHLPEGFGSLTNLINLNLEDNEFDTLPDNFGSLTNLSRLYLENNLFGDRPEVLERLGHLENDPLPSYPLNIKLIIDQEKLKQDPQWHLKDLINKIDSTILKNRKCDLYIEFVGDVGIDEGGLSREFLNQLFSRLIETNNSSFKMIDFSKLVVPNNHSPLHSMLGKVVMWYHPKLIGPHFDSSVFQLAFRLQSDEFDDDVSSWNCNRKIELYETLVKEQKNPHYQTLIDLLKIRKWTFEENQQAIEYLRDVLCIDALSNPREALLEEASNQFDSQLSGIRSFAQGMRSVLLKESEWNALALDVQAFESSVQGNFLDRADLVQKIVYIGNKMEVKKKVGWLKKWIINDATNEELQSMLHFYTGSQRLPQNQKLAVFEQAGNDQVPVPIAHTCFYRMDFASKPAGDKENLNDHTEENFIQALKTIIKDPAHYHFLIG